MITTGEYGGIKGFRNVYNNLEIEFKDEHEARNILELARYANVHTQKPLTTSELRFIYYYPDIAAKGNDSITLLRTAWGNQRTCGSTDC